jgi:hypothetical protein
MVAGTEALFGGEQINESNSLGSQSSQRILDRVEREGGGGEGDDGQGLEPYQRAQLAVAQA